MKEHNDDDETPRGDADEVPIGEPVTPVTVVATPLDAEKAAKFEKMKSRSKYLSIFAGLALVGHAGPDAYYGDNTGCNGLLVRTVMAWMALIGVLLVLAELEIACVRKYVNVLAYRSGRALVAIFASTICLGAAPSEVDLSYLTGGRTEGGESFVTHVDWPIGLIGVLLACSAAYTLRVSAKAKLQKLSSRTKSASGSSGKAGASKELM